MRGEAGTDMIDPTHGWVIPRRGDFGSAEGARGTRSGGGKGNRRFPKQCALESHREKRPEPGLARREANLRSGKTLAHP